MTTTPNTTVPDVPVPASFEDVVSAWDEPLHQACLGHGGGHTTWTCRTCDATVYGPPLNTHCNSLGGPAVVRVSNATYIPMVAGRVRARQCSTLTRLYPSLRLTIGKPIVVATTRVFSVIGRR